MFFCNSGAEANEAAIKLARKWAGHGRFGVVTTYGSLPRADARHPGRHRPAHQARAVRADARGLPPRRPATTSPPSRRAIDESVAAILLEPIQGEGGVNPATEEFLRAARRLADERNLLLMLDEVQTGLGRTGRWFGFHHYGIVPDVVCLAKALGNGVPIGALWARADVAGAFKPGDHGSTYSGQPLATAAARKVLEVMQRDDLPARAARAGRLPAGTAREARRGELGAGRRPDPRGRARIGGRAGPGRRLPRAGPRRQRHHAHRRSA